MTEYIMGKGEALPQLCVLHSSLITQNTDPYYESEIDSYAKQYITKPIKSQ